MSGERSHEYRLGLLWEGNRGDGTAHYGSYARRFRVTAAEKPDLVGSADPAFRGDAGLHNPEELLLAALAACHMLFYLSLCARSGVTVVGYADTPRGRLDLRPDGGGSIAEVTLSPRVTIASGSDRVAASALHGRAHELCFLANSVRFPIRHHAEVSLDDDAGATPAASQARPRGGAR